MLAEPTIRLGTRANHSNEKVFRGPDMKNYHPGRTMAIFMIKDATELNKKIMSRR